MDDEHQQACLRSDPSDNPDVGRAASGPGLGLRKASFFLAKFGLARYKWGKLRQCGPLNAMEAAPL